MRGYFYMAVPLRQAFWIAVSIRTYGRGRSRRCRSSAGGLDLAQPVPTGEAHQTYLRAVLLVADHTAYHLGQLVAVRRALGAWT